MRRRRRAFALAEEAGRIAGRSWRHEWRECIKKIPEYLMKRLIEFVSAAKPGPTGRSAQDAKSEIFAAVRKAREAADELGFRAVDKIRGTDPKRSGHKRDVE